MIPLQACSRAAFDISNEEILLLEVLRHFDRFEVYKFLPPPTTFSRNNNSCCAAHSLENNQLQPFTTAYELCTDVHQYTEQASESSNTATGKGGNSEIRKRSHIDIERGLA